MVPGVMCRRSPQKNGRTVSLYGPGWDSAGYTVHYCTGGRWNTSAGCKGCVHLDIPLLGINLGTLGFLAEVDKNSVYPALDRLLSDDYELEDRMMLEGKIYRGEELIGKDIALNDIVIGREGHLRVIRFKNYG